MIERIQVGGLRELRAAYNAVYARSEYGERDELYELVLRLLGAPDGARVLDVGCGAGPFGGYASRLRTVGVDLSDEALNRARAKDHPDLLLAQGERLPLSSGSFAYVVCLGNLEHFLDPCQGARELRRVLTSDGRAVIMLPNSRYSGDLWKRLRTGEGPNHHQPVDRFATCDEWRQLLEEAGLAVESVHRWDKGKRWKRLFPFQLAYHFVYVAGRKE